MRTLWKHGLTGLAREEAPNLWEIHPVLPLSREKFREKEEGEGVSVEEALQQF